MWRGGGNRLSTASTGSEDPCRSPSKFPIVATSGCFAKGDFAWRALRVPDAACRAVSGAEALVLGTSRVSRAVVLLERDAFGELHTVEVESARRGVGHARGAHALAHDAARLDGGVGRACAGSTGR